MADRRKTIEAGRHRKSQVLEIEPEQLVQNRGNMLEIMLTL